MAVSPRCLAFIGLVVISACGPRPYMAADTAQSTYTMAVANRSTGAVYLFVVRSVGDRGWKLGRVPAASSTVFQLYDRFLNRGARIKVCDIAMQRCVTTMNELRRKQTHPILLNITPHRPFSAYLN